MKWLSWVIATGSAVTVLSGFAYFLGGEVVERTQEFQRLSTDVEDLAQEVQRIHAEVDSLDRVIFERGQDLKIHRAFAHGEAP